MASIEHSLNDETNSEPELQQQPTFPLDRFIYFGHYRAYYPFGNTPAEDLLESCSSVSCPSVLFLGCGDMRSVFYTLWKNFDKKFAAPMRFEGVNFTLNDYSAAIMARNIILLHICLHLPEEAAERRKWLCALWAIWYCHELYPCHLEVLNRTMQSLLSYSGSTTEWSSKENPLHSLVQFTSSSSLAEVAETWKYWLKEAKVSKQEMQQSRYKLLKEKINDIFVHSFNLSKGHSIVYGDSPHVIQNKGLARAPEVKQYLNTGSCYAELAFGMNLPTGQTKLNVTMYERKDGMYTCHYGLVPYECYHHTVEFIPSKILNIPYAVVVPASSFKSSPFLANSLQQFCMIIQSSKQVLDDPSVNLSFSFDVQDALIYCQQQIQRNRLISTQECAKLSLSQTSYDVINTSNLMDHLNPLNLILACMPLLKEDGILFTLSLCCRGCSNTGEEYLSLLFGFSTELFPVILGVRCISHEGPKYSNMVQIDPSPPDLSHTLKCLPHIRIYYWVKESNFQKLVFSKLPKIEEGNITDALVNLLGYCTFSLMNHGPGQSILILSRNGIETAIAVLNRFAFFSGDFKLSPIFWGPLCYAVRQFGGPFLHSLQTQFLLHDVHVHLTLSERDCPVCQGKPLTDTVGLFCIRTKKGKLNYGTPFFMAFVHRCSSIDSEFLQSEALKGNDVHVFDCFDGSIRNDHLELRFFAPLLFARNYYNITLALVHKSGGKNIIVTVESLQLKDLQVPWVQYYFHECEDLPNSPATSFGTVSTHVCDSHKSETEIALSEHILHALSSNKLTTEKISNRKISIHCKGSAFDLQLLYPVVYDSIKTTLSKEKGVVFIACQRQQYSLEDERPCCIVTPDHGLSIPKVKVDMSIIAQQAIMSTTKEEARLAETSATAHLCSMDTKVKALLLDLFKGALKSSFFSLGSSNLDMQCLVVINKVMFDYQHKTPAVDLAYCFLNDHNRSTIMPTWLKGVDLMTPYFQLEEAGYDALKNFFRYFTVRTNGSLQSAGSSSNFSQLHKLKLEDYFTRAVVYLPLRDPDKALYATGDYYGQTTANLMPKVGGASCSWCRKLTFTAKQCGHCKTMSYCSKRCQVSHWSLHKAKCSGPSHKLTKCIYCKSSFPSANVRKPNCKCKDVVYCSSDCLQQDKLAHQKVCQANTPTNSTRKSDRSAAAGFPQCKTCGIQLSNSLKCLHCKTAEQDSGIDLKNHRPEDKTACRETPVKKKHMAGDHAASPEQKTLKGAESVSCHKVTTADDQQCSYCHKTSSNLKRCTKCYTVQYCNRDCQTSHWPEHKELCKENSKDVSVSPSPSSQKCSYCVKIMQNPVKCMKCGITQYCSSNCQEKHWPEHRVLCEFSSLKLTSSCAFCGSTSSKLLNCKKCKKVKYCGSKCQAAHWKTHKSVCFSSTE